MLVKLLPEQIAKQWKEIKPAIEYALPPITYGAENRMDRVLSRLLTDDMQCWVIYNDEQTRISGILTTCTTGDAILGTKNLLIYSLYGIEFTKRDFAQSFMTLSKYAKSKGCNRIVAYTDETSIIKLVKKIKGEARYTFVTVPLEDT